MEIPDNARFIVNTTDKIWMEVSFEDWCKAINKGYLVKECEHPKEKVSMVMTKWEGGLVVGSICPITGLGLSGERKEIATSKWFKCECGVIVEPETYKEKK